MQTFFRAFLSWWGLFFLGAIDATVAFVAPFGVDAALIYLAARDDSLFWLFPVMATSGSVLGAGLTYWMGKRAGEAGLKHLVNEGTLKRVQSKVDKSGAYAIAIPALLPPPFPLKPFILTCGAFNVDPTRFFITFAGVRGLRFGLETALARIYGDAVLNILESDIFEAVLVGLIGIAVIGTVVSGILIWRKARRQT